MRGKGLHFISILLLIFFSFNASAQFPGCPNVDAGPDHILDCSISCVTLEATPFETGATTSYTVSSINYAPPIAYNEPGGTAVSVGTDDVWSPVINLPFAFCFYGQTYTTATVGSNGSISLGSTRTGSQPWSFSASVPSSSLNSAGNIFGVYHDMQPGTSAGGSVRYYLLGQAPCRILAVVFDNLPHYNSSRCPGTRSSSMIVLYETTNAIDVYVERKDLCTNWNSGNAVIGIQRNGGGTGLAAPGRNTGQWSVSSSNPEAWRFSPNGAPIYTVEWQDENGNVLSNNTTLQVCPTVETTYTAVATYQACGGGGPIVVYDDVTVTPNTDTPNISAPNHIEVCIGEDVTLTANNPDGHTVVWDNGINNAVPFTPGAIGSTLYTVSATDNNCTTTDTVTVTVQDLPTINAGPDQTICNGESVTLNGSGGSTYTWNNGVLNGTPFIPTSSGNYMVTGTDNNGCENTDQVAIVINPLPTGSIAGNAEVCMNDNQPTITFTGADGTTPYTFTYTINGGAQQTVTSTGNTATVAAPTGTDGTFTYELVAVADANGCSNPATGNAVITVNPLPIASVTGTTAVCQNDTEPTITITGSNGTAPYTFTYAINGGTQQTVTSTGNTATISVPTGTTGDFTYEIISVTDASTTACENTVNNQSATITVSPLPTATIAGAAEVCVNDNEPTITFTGANGTAPYTFTYTINGGAQQTVTTTGNTATVTTPTGADGTFTYALISVEDNSTSTCGNTVSGQNAVVIVNPLPTATIAGTTEVCQDGEQPTITFTGANGTAPYTITYTINGGTQQTVTTIGNNATVTAPTGTAGTYTYEIVSVTDNSATACSNTVTGQSAVVTVNPLPTATIAGTIDVCRNDTEPTITFTGSNGTAPYLFEYSINGGTPQTITSTGNTATVTAPTNADGTFTYEIISVQDNSSTHCSNYVTGQTAIVTVNPLPTATITGTTEVCQDDAEPTITFTGADGTAPYTFTYTINGGAPQTVTSTGNTATVTAPTSADGTFTYEITSVQDNSSTTCSNTVTGQASVITVNPLPTATITGDVIVCKDDAEPTITFTGADGTAPYTFTYTINGGTPQTVTSTGNTATVTAPTGTQGTFTYELISVQDNSSTTCSNAVTGQTAVVQVSPLPEAAIAGSIDVCEGDTYPELTFTGLIGEPIFTYTYTINGGPVQTLDSDANSYTQTLPVSTATPGTYTYDLVIVHEGSIMACFDGVHDQTAIVVVNPLPTATIAGTTDVCENDAEPTITFTGAGGTAPYTFTYSINGGAQQTVTSTGNTATITAPTNVDGAFTYELISVQDASSTTCSNAVTDQTATVLVNPLPTATIDGTIDVCQNDAEPTITFTGANGTAPYIFTYTINGGAQQTITSTGNTATITVPTTMDGTYTYTLISVQDNSSTTCTNGVSGQSATVLVNPLSSASVVGVSNIDVCQNDLQPTITFTASLGTAPYVFTYTINGGAPQTVTSTGNSATVSVPTTTVGTFTYELISVQDNSSTACSNSVTGETVVVLVNPLPTATIDGTTDVCQDDAHPTLTFTGADGTAPYTFTYTINGGSPQTVVSSGNTATITVPTNNAGVFSYQLVSVQDASSTSCLNSVTGQIAVVTVNPLPSASITAQTAEVCQYDDAPQVTFTGSMGTAPYTFTYTVNGGAPQTITSPGNSVSITVPTDQVGTTVYELISVQDNSSTNCSSENQASGTITVTVNPIPDATASGSIVVCENDPSPVVTFTGQDGTGDYLFIYNINNGNDRSVMTNNSDNANINVPTNDPGNYSYHLTAVTDVETGCTREVSIMEIIDVGAGPTASFYANPDQLYPYNWESQMVNQSTGAVDYMWDFGDDLGTSTEVSPSHAFPNKEGGTYLVTLVATSMEGCTDTAYREVRFNEEILFYVPNTFTPDGDDHNEMFLPVFTAGFDPMGYTLYIFDRWGELIFESHNSEIGWKGTYGEDGKLCKDGTYVWKIDVRRQGNNKGIETYTGHVNLIK